MCRKLCESLSGHDWTPLFQTCLCSPFIMAFPLISHWNSVFQHSEEALCFWIFPLMLDCIGNYFKLTFCQWVYFLKIFQFCEVQMLLLCNCCRNREWAASGVYLVLTRLWVASCYLKKISMRQCSKIRLFFLILIFYCYSITVVCLFSPSLHPTPANPPPSPISTLPLDFVHASFIVVPVIPSPHCPLPTPPCPMLDCS